jgi:protein-S-isoprenylcysteine O-methyltransferase Ste14
MLAETIIATFLLICLTCFFSINLHNILRLHKHNNDTSEPQAEIERPSGLAVDTAAFGTLIYFVEALLYLLVAFSHFPFPFTSFPLNYQYSFALYVQALGVILTATGYFLFLWSVIARGKYAVSWEMRKTHKLVTWGPYKCVRHPSYLGYFLMFLGMAAFWPNVLALVPLVAIPGYLEVSSREERLLELHFGNEYLEYKKKTGRFIPRLRHHSHIGEETSEERNTRP